MVQKLFQFFHRILQKGNQLSFATYLLSDPTSGELLALIEGATLTGLRTGGASALATRYLSREDARVLGVIGTGFQATFQVKAIRAVRPIEEVWAYDIDSIKLDGFCKNLASFIPVHPSLNQAEVVKKADILVTSTTSNTPVFSGKDLKPGTHINAIGAFRPTMREVDEETILKATIVMDTYEGCLSEAGDLLIPIQGGKLKREAIHGDLGEIITGRKRGRRSPEEITLFKSVGFAMEDVVVAHRAYEKAIRECKGQQIEIF